MFNDSQVQLSGTADTHETEALLGKGFRIIFPPLLSALLYTALASLKLLPQLP